MGPIAATLLCYFDPTVGAYSDLVGRWLII